MNSESSMEDSFEPKATEQLLCDLRLRQLELESQNEHLKNALAKYEQSARYYENLFNNAPVGYVLLAEDGLILDANLAATELFGLERHDLLSCRFGSFVALDDGGTRYLLFAALIKFNQAFDIEMTLKHAQGSTFSVQLNCRIINSTIHITITDINKINRVDTVLPDVNDMHTLQTKDWLTLKNKQDSQSKLEKITNSVPGVIYQYLLRSDSSSCFPYANEAFYDIYRLRPDDVRENAFKLNALIHPDDYQEFFASMQASARDLTPWDYEYRIIFDDNSVRWVWSNSIPQREMDGSTLWHGFSIDITERKKLANMHSLSTIALKSISQGVLIMDASHNILWINKAFELITGYDHTELLNQNCRILEGPLTNLQTISDIALAFKTPTQFSGEILYYRKDATSFWNELTITPVYNDLGKLSHFISTTLDITERKELESSCQQLQQELHILINQSPISIAMFDNNMNYLEANDLWTTEFCRGIKDFKGCNHYQVCSEIPGRWRDLHQQGLAGEILKKEADCWIKTDGSKYWLNWAISPWFNKDRSIGGIIISSENITERKLIEQRLSEENAFNLSVLDSLAMSICVLNELGIIVTVNKLWNQFGLINGLSVSYQSFIGVSYLDSCASYNKNLDYDHDAIAARHGISAVLAGDLGVFEMEYPCHSPCSQRWFNLKVTRLENSSGYVVVSHEDITQHIQRERINKQHLDQLAHVTRLGLMAELASSLTRELSQPLVEISKFTQASLFMINNENLDLVKLAEIIAKTKEQALRAGQIIQRMKECYQFKSHKRLATDINELINQSVHLCSDYTRQNSIGFKLKLDDKLPLISIDPIQVEQVLINLIRNAMDAILSMSKNKKGLIIIQSFLTPDNKIQVSVKDNGPGIQEERQHKILMPYHTTKENGMSIGLFVSRSLIEAHHGSLSFNSKFGKGSTFHFTLPIE